MAHFLAFDLGAESGRAVLGGLHGDVLDVREIHRFVNEPVRQNGSLHWDVLRLWLEIKRGLEAVAVNGQPIAGIGVDAWGCDYALIGERGALLQNPYHYRDKRTDGVMESVFERVPAEQIYDVTGIQFLPFNTLYQLYAACRDTPRLVDAATAFGTIPDLVNFWLTGELAAEFTNATTTQFVDARTRTWAFDLLRALDLPTRILPSIVESGTVIGTVLGDAPDALRGTPVVAPACHDTGSAVAAVSAGGHRAFISSGTWSLLGTELASPVITPRARELNFTNEGGVLGTTRLLKNIAGLWLLQSCRRNWADQGVHLDYEELLVLARAHQSSFQSLFDPDHAAFLHPRSMVTAIAEYCRETGQPEPDGPAGYARAILESLAFKYRVVLESMERLTGIPITEVRIVGGGSRNRLLNQFTADSTGRTVIAGPVEASALGNIAMQIVATGVVGTLDDARRIIERSFPVERFEPIEPDRWNAHYRRFHEYLEPTCV